MTYETYSRGRSMEAEQYFLKGEDHGAFLERMHNQQEEETEKLYRMLPEGDLEMIVMKGHLMIEQRMTNIMKAMSIRPECIDRSNMTYAQLSWCCRALTTEYDWDDDDIWRAVSKINEARNCIAHELNPRKKLTAYMKEAYKLAFGRYHSNRKATENTRQMLAELLFILGFKVAVAKYRKARTKSLLWI